MALESLEMTAPFAGFEHDEFREIPNLLRAARAKVDQGR
jgi:hypothetical protein